MFDTYTPEDGDELMVCQAFSLDKDPERETPQFQPGDLFDPEALGVSLFRVRDFLKKGRLELLSMHPRAAIDVQGIDEAAPPVETAPPAQSAASEADS